MTSGAGGAVIGEDGVLIGDAPVTATVSFAGKYSVKALTFLENTQNICRGASIIDRELVISCSVRVILQNVRVILQNVRVILPNVCVILPNVRIILPNVRIILPN